MIAFRRLLRSERGASAVEFALLAGPFLLLLFGVVEFSRGLWTRQVLLDVTTSAARCVAVVQQECADAKGDYSLKVTEGFVLNQARGLGVKLREPIVVRDNTTCNGLDGFAYVELEANFESIFPIDQLLNFTSHSCFARQV